MWQAIYDHYLPINIEDRLPRTVSGAVVSLADKMDTLVGLFSVGIRATGSRDPFGLRRAAQGIIQILLNRDDREIRITVHELFQFAFAAHNTAVDDEFVAFFSDRVQTILQSSAYGFRYDEIQAAMHPGYGLLTDLVERVAALKMMRSEPNFLSILDSAKRIANITVGHTPEPIDLRLLREPEEVRLNELATMVGDQIDEMISERNYVRAMQSFAAMAPELESFFKEVMVMVDDNALRRNRMSLLQKVGQAAGKIADVTKIVVDRSDYRA